MCVPAKVGTRASPRPSLGVGLTSTPLAAPLARSTHQGGFVSKGGPSKDSRDILHPLEAASYQPVSPFGRPSEDNRVPLHTMEGRRLSTRHSRDPATRPVTREFESNPGVSTEGRRKIAAISSIPWRSHAISPSTPVRRPSENNRVPLHTKEGRRLSTRHSRDPATQSVSPELLNQTVCPSSKTGPTLPEKASLADHTDLRHRAPVPWTSG